MVGSRLRSHVRSMTLRSTTTHTEVGPERRSGAKVDTSRERSSTAGRLARSLRLGRILLHLLLNASVVVVASGIGHALARPAPQTSSDAERTVRSLVTRTAAENSIPEDFADVLGYRPAASSGVLSHPAGGCSTPLGLGPSEFEPACRIHDFKHGRRQHQHPCQSEETEGDDHPAQRDVDRLSEAGDAATDSHGSSILSRAPR